MRQILITAIVLAASAVSLLACGQQGALYLPGEGTPARRASLPESLRPGWLGSATDQAPARATDAASAATNPVSR